MKPVLAVRPALEIPLDEPAAPHSLVAPRVEVLTSGDALDHLPPLAPAPAARRVDPRASPEFTPFACSEQIDQLTAAMTEASLEFEEIERNREADVQSRREGARSFKYRYATLGVVIQATRPALARHGLALFQFPVVRSKSLTILNLISHTSGQWMRNDVPIVLDSLDPQTVGKGITYMRRYSQLSILNLAPEDDEDTDANMSHRGPRSSPAQDRPGQGSVAMPQRQSTAAPPNGAASGTPDTATAPSTVAGVNAPAVAAAPAPGSALFTVKAIDPRKKVDGTPYWVVAFEDVDTGATLPACTFDVQLVNTLLRMKSAGTQLAEVVTHQQGNWTFVNEVRIAGGGGQ